MDFDLTHGDDATIAEFLGVTTRTARRYRRTPSAMPEPCRRLLRLRRCGDLAALGGDAWEGFRFGADGLLYLPLWRNGWQPEQIKAMFFRVQQVAALEAELKKLKSEVWALRKIRYVARAPDRAHVPRDCC